MLSLSRSTQNWCSVDAPPPSNENGFAACLGVPGSSTLHRPSAAATASIPVTPGAAGTAAWAVGAACCAGTAWAFPVAPVSTVSNTTIGAESLRMFLLCRPHARAKCFLPEVQQSYGVHYCAAAESALWGQTGASRESVQCEMNGFYRTI